MIYIMSPPFFCGSDLHWDGPIQPVSANLRLPQRSPCLARTDRARKVIAIRPWCGCPRCLAHSRRC